MNAQIEQILDTALSNHLMNINRAGLSMSNIQATLEACIDFLQMQLLRTHNAYAVQDASSY